MTVDLMSLVAKTIEEERNYYFVELRFRDKVLGTQPKSREVMKKWLESKHVAAEIIEEQMAKLSPEQNIEEETQMAWTGFFTDERGPWIGTYQVKAMFREMLTTLGITVEKRGSKQTYQHLMEILACDVNRGMLKGPASSRLYLWREGQVVSEPDGSEERTGHVVTPQGPRSILKKHDYIAQASLRFLVSVPARMAEGRSTSVLGDREVARCLAHGGGDGIGCSRSQGFGTFDVVVLDRITDNPFVKRAPKDTDGEGAGEDGEAPAKAAKRGRKAG